ncbi:hypothetical protein C1H46_042541 [Malus baccata]|uniref:Uncharacterized protein n=1 Tax=Malus baccata TaxID=106549 RepID=A0A540KD85_MALBA|nr:hypothetical protein C1H46_042541 [Malus baccata]
MDPHRRGFSNSFNGVQLGNQPLPILSHPTVVAGSRFDSNTPVLPRTVYLRTQVEEASRFFPRETNLVVELEANGMSVHKPKVGAAASYVNVERTDEREYSSADDHRNANELLKKVRHHSSPFGDGTQRLAHCFANGLEACLAGTGSQIYKGLVSKRTSAADILKAYHLYLAAFPFKKMSNFVTNVTIMNLAEKSRRLHVIDFGILYGFQWPTLIQRISWREGVPSKVRITGIEFPQLGFRPAERVEETGRRLAAYAEKFNMPFEYNAIAKKWETITLEELKIDKDGVLVVNFLYQGKNLLDESVFVDSVRNRVLDLIRRINPDIFIHGVVNGAYNAPFFVTRFREALFHFSSLFDMLETVVPREDQERVLIEKEIFGREALNVIACEGWERVERPETYKQWHVCNLRAGFVQIPFDRELVKAAAKKVSSLYHKDFVIDEDSRWLLQGWKGRTAFALSAWKPA